MGLYLLSQGQKWEDFDIQADISSNPKIVPGNRRVTDSEQINKVKKIAEQEFLQFLNEVKDDSNTLNDHVEFIFTNLALRERGRVIDMDPFIIKDFLDVVYAHEKKLSFLTRYANSVLGKETLAGHEKEIEGLLSRDHKTISDSFKEGYQKLLDDYIKTIPNDESCSVTTKIKQIYLAENRQLPVSDIELRRHVTDMELIPEKQKIIQDLRKSYYDLESLPLDYQDIFMHIALSRSSIDDFVEEIFECLILISDNEKSPIANELINDKQKLFARILFYNLINYNKTDYNKENYDKVISLLQSEPQRNHPLSEFLVLYFSQLHDKDFKSNFVFECIQSLLEMHAEGCLFNQPSIKQWFNCIDLWKKEPHTYLKIIQQNESAKLLAIWKDDDSFARKLLSDLTGDYTARQFIASELLRQLSPHDEPYLSLIYETVLNSGETNPSTIQLFFDNYTKVSAKTAERICKLFPQKIAFKALVSGPNIKEYFENNKKEIDWYKVAHPHMLLDWAYEWENNLKANPPLHKMVDEYITNRTSNHNGLSFAERIEKLTWKERKGLYELAKTPVDVQTKIIDTVKKNKNPREIRILLNCYRKQPGSDSGSLLNKVCSFYQDNYNDFSYLKPALDKLEISKFEKLMTAYFEYPENVSQILKLSLYPKEIYAYTVECFLDSYETKANGFIDNVTKMATINPYSLAILQKAPSTYEPYFDFLVKEDDYIKGMTLVKNSEQFVLLFENEKNNLEWALRQAARHPNAGVLFTLLQKHIAHPDPDSLFNKYKKGLEAMPDMADKILQLAKLHQNTSHEVLIDDINFLLEDLSDINGLPDLLDLALNRNFEKSIFAYSSSSDPKMSTDSLSVLTDSNESSFIDTVPLENLRVQIDSFSGTKKEKTAYIKTEVCAALAKVLLVKNGSVINNHRLVLESLYSTVPEIKETDFSQFIERTLAQIQAQSGQIIATLNKASLPKDPNNPMQELLRQQLRLGEDQPLTEDHVRKAIFATLLLPTRQGDYGSCFSTQSMIIRQSDPTLLIDQINEMIELIANGSVSKTTQLYNGTKVTTEYPATVWHSNCENNLARTREFTCAQIGKTPFDVRKNLDNTISVLLNHPSVAIDLLDINIDEKMELLLKYEFKNQFKNKIAIVIDTRPETKHLAEKWILKRRDTQSLVTTKEDYADTLVYILTETKNLHAEKFPSDTDFLSICEALLALLQQDRAHAIAYITENHPQIKEGSHESSLWKYAMGGNSIEVYKAIFAITNELPSYEFRASTPEKLLESLFKYLTILPKEIIEKIKNNPEYRIAISGNGHAFSIIANPLVQKNSFESFIQESTKKVETLRKSILTPETAKALFEKTRDIFGNYFPVAKEHVLKNAGDVAFGEFCDRLYESAVRFTANIDDANALVADIETVLRFELDQLGMDVPEVLNVLDGNWIGEGVNNHLMGFSRSFVTKEIILLDIDGPGLPAKVVVEPNFPHFSEMNMKSTWEILPVKLE